ncbi:NACHT domain-containing protein [Francisella uliginis]|uniref:Uncharacterized protein n=1 Tax=Francisella uliginis TaxID=573570 RepID=A0A1L4BSY5_9GAMM|nr:hypothetical protein [Francisella uliginis]API86945.1 hypothetical protein F7310_06055 [Francisella uliginis]
MLNNNVIIDLNYKDRETGQILRLKSIISNDFSVILGSPGSGKTQPLKKYEKSNPKVQFFKIVAGIKNLVLDDETEVLLLDGLDEFLLNDNCYKFFAQLKKFLNKSVKIVLTCRETEWTKELEDELNENYKTPKIYTIEPLNYRQQKELAFKYGIEDSFIETVDNKFLANPQMFSMILELWKNDKKDIKDKQTLFREFISLASDESNVLYKKYMLKEEDKLYRYLGYLAFFYIFSDMREFNDKSLKIIACDSYEREIIDKVIKTRLFSDRTFIHRPIAEFILAKFILKALDSEKLNFRRIQSYFIKDKVAIPKLKGTYAWIRTLNNKYDFEKINAYEQLIYGDIPKLEERKGFILQVKEESKKNPYFRYNLRNETSDIDTLSQEKALYSTEIENFLIDEFDKTKDLNNNYPMFIVNILTKGEAATKKYIISSIKNNSINEHFITCFMTLFKDDKTTLDFILDKVSKGNIADKNNHIKEQYISLLHDELRGNEIGKIISSYNYTDSYITIYFIEFDELDIVKQEEIIASLGQNITTSNKYIDNNIEKLIERFLVNIILAYCDNQISNEKAYQTFKKVRELFYKNDNRLANINIPTYRLNISQQKIVENLFEFFFEKYVEDILSSPPDRDGRYYFFNFDNYFFYDENIDKLKVFLLTVDKEYTENIKKELLINTLPYSNDSNLNKIITKAEEHDLKDWLEEKIKVRKQIREEDKLKQKQQSDAWTLAERKEIDGFINYISIRSDDDLYKNLQFMYYIANLFLFENNKLQKLPFDVKRRLNNLLQNFIYTKGVSHLTIESIVKEDFLDKRRYISNICFVSTYLNEDNLSKIPKDIKKYLYINALRYKYYKISTDSFLEYIENDIEFAIKTLNETVGIIIDEYFPEIKSFFGKYLDKDNIEDLKLFVGISADNKESLQNELAKQFLYKYANKLCVSEQDFSEFISISNLKEAKAIEKLIKNAEVNFDLDDACYLKEILMKNHKLFQCMDKIRLVSFIMKQFVSEKDFGTLNNYITKEYDLFLFLANNLFPCLSYMELSQLLELPYINKDIWGDKIYQRIQENRQISFKNHKYEVEVVKGLILENKIVDYRDFFEETCYRLENLKNEIESNRNNDKLDFYNEPKETSKKVYSPKDEDRCRDVILRRLSDKYIDILCTSEKLEADNRADLNIKYKSNIEYEVQIECKKDKHRKLYESINNQLIKLYLEDKVEYGIYLIFYFGEKRKNKQYMFNKLEKGIQEEYKNKIKVICIDLTVIKKV